MEWIIGIFVALLVITLAGHVIWVIAARILGFRTSTVRAGGVLSQTFCPHCGHAALSPAGICSACRRSIHAPPPINDSRRTIAHIARLVQAGLIDADIQARVIAAVAAENEPPTSRPALAPLPVLPRGPAELKQKADIAFGEDAPAFAEPLLQVPLPPWQLRLPRYRC